MPGSNIVAIVTLSRSSGCRSKVIEITGCAIISSIAICAARSEILVVSYDRPRDRFEAPPAQIIGLYIGLIPSAVILIIPQGQDGSQARIYKQVGSVFRPAGA